jgi:hypothetical protein
MTEAIHTKKSELLVAALNIRSIVVLCGDYWHLPLRLQVPGV